MIRNDIESLRIKGFRSIENIEMDGLPRVAVLIGANGSGKSNVLRFVEMLGWMTRRSGGRLAEFAERHGGGSGQLFRGAAFTERIEGEIGLRRGGVRHGYRFELACAADERLFFSREEMLAGAGPAQPGEWLTVGNGHSESAMPGEAVRGKDPTGAQIICETFAGCSVYHFRDTSASTGIRRNCDPEDYARLRPDGSNLAAVLHWLERTNPGRLDWICRQIGRILPAFDRFGIERTYGRVRLRWKERGSDRTFGAHLTSDGSLRFFALATLLYLPAEALPDVILLDEPELGLHPAAVSLLGGMIRSLSAERQIVVATQSPQLVDALGADSVFVADLADGRTEVGRLDRERFSQWLEDGYGVGELWQRNLIGGYP